MGRLHEGFRSPRKLERETPWRSDFGAARIPHSSNEKAGSWRKRGPCCVTDIGVDKLVFVKRLTYNSNHYYTEYINSPWTPGGNLCVLDLKDGSVRDCCAAA